MGLPVAYLYRAGRSATSDEMSERIMPQLGMMPIKVITVKVEFSWCLVNGSKDGTQKANYR